MSLKRICIIPTVVVLGLMLLPVIVVLGISIGPSSIYQFPPTAVSGRWFAALFSSRAFMESIFEVSLPLGVCVAIAATIVGSLAAIGIVRLEFRGKSFVESVFLGPVIFPQILLAVGLFLMFARLEITPTLWTLALGHLLISCPYVVRTVIAGLTGADRRIEEAAQNLGASPFMAFCRVTLPSIRLSIVSGAIFAFIVSFSDVNLALFLSAADSTTLPIQVLSQMQMSSDPTIAAAASVQVLIVSSLLLLVQRLLGSIKL